GSSIWIHVAPSAISASRFGRMMLRGMSSVSSPPASPSPPRGRPPPRRPARGRWCSSYDQTARVYAPVIGIFRSCFAAEPRKENSSLWYGSLSETGPTAADFEEDFLSNERIVRAGLNALAGATAAG